MAAAPARGRVVVVDDDAAMRRLFAIRLEEDGFEVRVFATGQECLARAADFDPEVILLDINMPGLDGIETCRRLKQVPDLHDVPIVFVTGQRDDDPTTVEALRAGGNDFISKDASQPVMLARLGCQITIHRAQRQLRRIAMTDELTGLFSRRFLFDSLRRVVKASTRKRPGSIACLLCDLDHFKAINDVHGHIAGDEALRKVADVIRKATRETDIVGRFGGEEFVIILTDSDEAGAMTVAEKIRTAVEREAATTVSIGVTVLTPGDGELLRRESVLEELVRTILHRADTAMYASKRAGRNRVTLWTDELA
ncbi:MAG: diguanylate cyclase [Acidobacteriota bacterium]